MQSVRSERDGQAERNEKLSNVEAPVEEEEEEEETLIPKKMGYQSFGNIFGSTRMLKIFYTVQLYLFVL